MKLRCFGSATLALPALICFATCGDYSIQLPGRYALTRVHGDAVLIHHPDKGVVIDANIDGYEVIDGLIVGHVSLATHAPEKELSKPGYFILNTKTHEVRLGLEKKTWLDSLNALAITKEPGLHKPSRFARDYKP